MALKRRKTYEGEIEKLLSKKIYLNINHLEKGIYELNIIYKNKAIKIISFKRP
jgi:hypothetical protein